jgi:predicted nucleic-acid-binding Zn-ribbon protein
MSYHRCPKCASPNMVDGAWVAPAQGTRIVVGIDRHPDRGPLPHPMSTQVHACVCGACGYVELYANKPGELYEAYREVEVVPSPPGPTPS